MIFHTNFGIVPVLYCISFPQKKKSTIRRARYITINFISFFHRTALHNSFSKIKSREFCLSSFLTKAYARHHIPFHPISSKCRRSNALRHQPYSNKTLRSLPCIMHGRKWHNSTWMRILVYHFCNFFSFLFFQVVLVEGEDRADLKGPTDGDWWFCVQVTSNCKSWQVRRSLDNFQMLDRQLHRCVYDRKFSLLKEINVQPQEPEVSVAVYEIIKKMFLFYTIKN